MTARHPPSPSQDQKSCGGLLTALCTALGCLLLGFSTHAAERAAGETQIKAAFLANFAKFTSWEGVRPNPGADFTMAVVSDAGFAEELRAVVRGRSIGGRPVRVRLLHSLGDVPAMDMLFIPEGMENEARTHIPLLHRLGVLTVGESARFAEIGGVINFQMQSGKVKFSINRRGAEGTGLKISPQLLKLAIMEGGSAR